MESIKKSISINYREKQSFNTIDYNYSGSNKGAMKKEEAEQIIDSVSDLIDDEAFKPFFFSQLYKLGREDFIALAEKVRAGEYEYPGRKFASSLKYRRRFR